VICNKDFKNIEESISNTWLCWLSKAYYSFSKKRLKREKRLQLNDCTNCHDLSTWRTKPEWEMTGKTGYADWSAIGQSQASLYPFYRESNYKGDFYFFSKGQSNVTRDGLRWPMLVRYLTGKRVRWSHFQAKNLKRIHWIHISWFVDHPDCWFLGKLVSDE